MDNNKDMAKWLNAAEIQKVQDSFSNLTGMSAVAIDLDGKELTKKSNPTEYCEMFSSCSIGSCSLCTECRKYGAKEAQLLGKATTYYCHLGLIEFAAPVVIDSVPIAYIIGGMIFESEPNEEIIRSYAARYKMDGDELWLAAKKVPVIDSEQIQKSADFLYSVSSVIAGVASSRMHMAEATKEMEEASRIKSDFIANMSHEIRTPMNAVLGMTAVALQEEMSPSAAEYVRQIQTSGKSLLHLLNDILDYSKLVNGHMNVIETEYEPVKILHELSAIVPARLRRKNKIIDLFIDIDPNVPTKLKGDPERIQQVLINIAGNAVKFTNDGYIRIYMRTEKISDTKVNLVVSVEDTGIGIKDEDLNKLFNSFSQLDSDRNRNFEGMGLGLAISHGLISFMGGALSVESSYGTGSVFTVEIPQIIVDETPVAKIENPERIAALTYIENQAFSESFHNSADLLGIPLTSSRHHVSMSSAFQKWSVDHQHSERFLFIDEENLKNGIVEEINLGSPDYDKIHRIVIVEQNTSEDIIKDYPFLTYLRKPVFTETLAAVFRGSADVNEKIETIIKEPERFTVEGAKVLVVDDNKVNLRVAEKLINMVGIDVDKAFSGTEALDILSQKSDYDIIFMDHMMPELDGVETTRLIRRLHPEMAGIPIIALTANTLDEAKKLFFEEGMNDFIAKPIDIKILNEKIRTWIHPSKIKIITPEAST